MKTNRFVTLLTFLAILASLILVTSKPARAASFVVDSNSDDANAHDKNPGDGLCQSWLDECTLRAAVEESNDLAGADTITFQTAMNIYVDNSLGSIPLYDTVTIDASGVWDTANDMPGVMLNGNGASFAGLYIGADMCQIYGLYITNFSSDGILVVSADNWIGGTAAGQRNVLSGNQTGVTLFSSASQWNILHNNYIGLTPAGDAKNPNDIGLLITGGSANNIVGGSGTIYVNYISGNTSEGIIIEGTGTDNNWLGTNVIGLATDLSTNLGNGAYGILIQNGAANTVIGGASNSGNIISYNTYSGVRVRNVGSGTRITDNVFGSNGVDGIEINDSAGCVISDNLIGGNILNGVSVKGASAVGNLIWPNSIFSNGAKGIALDNGGNMNITAPVISSASSSGASGTVCAGCRVALYSDSGDEGQIYHDIVVDDGAGNWTYSGTLAGPNVTATAIDISGNTSEFSAPYTLSPANQPPDTPSNPSPTDKATDVSRTPTLTWSGGDPDGDTVLYTVYGQEATAVVSDLWCAASTSTSCQPGFTLKESTKYYWFVRADDGNGGQVDGPFWEFTTVSETTSNYMTFLPLVSR
jgi:hypothetical protein